MRADGVDPEKLRPQLRAVVKELGAPFVSPPDDGACCAA